VVEGWKRLHNEELYNLKEDEMGGTCSTPGTDEEIHRVVWLENMKGRKHLEDLGVNGRIILERMLGI
jgi:hypothetical protein